MKVLLFLSFLFSVPHLLAQETRLVHKRSTSERYEVLKHNKKIRHGTYEKRSYFDKVLIEGVFQNNLEHGTWKFYSGYGVAEQGNYAEGVRVGPWEFYDLSGNLELKYDFTTGKVLDFKRDSLLSLTIVNTQGDTIQTKDDRPPLFLGSSALEMGKLQRLIKMPRSALYNGFRGRVIVGGIVDTTGLLTDHKIIRSGGKDIDATALFAFKNSFKTWIPAEVNGKKKAAPVAIPILFQSMSFQR